MAVAELVVTITNFNYTTEMEDQQSEVYREFGEHFRKEVRKIYGDVPGYEGVVIVGLSPVTTALSGRGPISGSRVRRDTNFGVGVVVAHEVVVSTDTAGPNVTAELNGVTAALVAKLRQTESSQGDCQHNTSVLCLTVSPDPIVSGLTPTKSLDALCSSLAPVGFQPFYYAVTSGPTVRCVTACAPNTAHTIDCNSGHCRVSTAGPHCQCWDGALYWYAGQRCTGRVSKVGFGLGLLAALLLLLCAALTALLLRRRARSAAPPSDGAHWYELDSAAWPSPDGFAYRNSAAGCSLRSFTPSLDAVNTSVPMQIARPTVHTRF